MTSRAGKIKSDILKAIYSSIPILFFMWILFGYNTYNGDYAEYENQFNLGKQGTFEEGFKLLLVWARALGISNYQDFLKISSFLFLLIVFYFACKYTKRPKAVMTLFLIYPFLVLCETVRYAFVFLFILTGISILLSDKKNSILLYVILVFIASMFNTSALLYLVLAFYKVPLKRRQKFNVMFILCLIISVLTYTQVFYFLAYHLLGTSKILGWLGNHARYGMIIPISEQIISFLIFQYGYQLSKKYNIRTKMNGDILYDLNIMILILLPLYFITVVFIRAYYVFLFVNMIFFFEIIYRDSGSRIRFTKLNILNFIQFGYFAAIHILPRSDIWKVHFTNNLVFERLSEFL